MKNKKSESSLTWKELVHQLSQRANKGPARIFHRHLAIRQARPLIPEPGRHRLEVVVQQGGDGLDDPEIGGEPSIRTHQHHKEQKDAEVAEVVLRHEVQVRGVTRRKLGQQADETGHAKFERFLRQRRLCRLLAASGRLRVVPSFPQKGGKLLLDPVGNGLGDLLVIGGGGLFGLVDRMSQLGEIVGVEALAQDRVLACPVVEQDGQHVADRQFPAECVVFPLK